MTLTSEQTVRDIAIQNPAAVRVFEALRIDYCCGGKRPLRDACQRAHVPVAQAMELLAQTGRETPEDRHWSDAPFAELTGHIVARHHSYIRRETPRLEVLLDKVAVRHGADHPELLAIRELFVAMSQELVAHMAREEQVLFPILAKIEAAPPAFLGGIDAPIARMMADHDDAGELMAQIRALSQQYRTPEGACASYIGLYYSLEAFERDLHFHVHLENNILFPRALELYRALRG